MNWNQFDDKLEKAMFGLAVILGTLAVILGTIAIVGRLIIIFFNL